MRLRTRSFSLLFMSKTKQKKGNFSRHMAKNLIATRKARALFRKLLEGAQSFEPRIEVGAPHPSVLSTCIPVLAPLTKHDGQLRVGSCGPTFTLTSIIMMRSAGTFFEAGGRSSHTTDPHPRDLMACVQVFLLHVVDACTSALNVSVAAQVTPLAKPQGDTDRFP